MYVASFPIHEGEAGPKISFLNGDAAFNIYLHLHDFKAESEWELM